MLKTISSKILTALPEQDMGFASGLAVSILQMAIRSETQDLESTEEIVESVSQILLEIIEEQVSTVRHSNSSLHKLALPGENDQESSHSPKDCLTRMPLFRVEYKQISFFFGTILNMIQNCTIE